MAAILVIRQSESLIKVIHILNLEVIGYLMIKVDCPQKQI